MSQARLFLSQCNWVSRRADQGPKTIEQIHKEAKIEEQEEQRKVQQLMTKEKRRPGKINVRFFTSLISHPLTTATIL